MTQRGRAGGRSPGRSSPQGATIAPQPRSGSVARRERLRAVVEPVVRAAGFDLEEISLSRAGRRDLVRVTVDADGGVDLDAVAVVSRALSEALDGAECAGADLMSGEYQLEVSSPGVDRPLRLPRHWRRNLGRLVRVTAGGRQVTARVAGVDDDLVRLDVDGDVQQWRCPDLGPGRVQVEFNRLDEVADEDLAPADGPVDDDDDEVEDEER